ncbi:AAA family ATPase [Actinomycetospora sp. CA-101289]|uniref:AAA family ATPase n=1 Tax=Actinomycetospora sp. CA-101289 TaxID=3239893 RepID=UPI003D980031
MDRPTADRAARPPVRGRDDVLARYDAALAHAIDGCAGLLVVEGDPGSGKTTVAAEAVRRAGRSGVRVVEVAGHDGEADLALAGLSLVLRRLGDHLDALTDGQRRAIGVATGAVDEPLVDRFALGAATFALLGATARDRPLLLVLDDAQWLDVTSVDALAFAIRRLDTERVLVVATTRPGLSALADLPEAHRLALPGLATAELGTVLADRGLPTAPDVVARIAEATAGLPLAVVETARTLDGVQRAGRGPLPDPLPIGGQVTRAYEVRLRALPARTRDAVALLALAGSAPAPMLAAAMRALDLAVADLAPAEDVGAVRVGGGIAFTHPLLRAAALTLEVPARRRELHAVLARAAGDDVERRARHLAAAAVGPDEHAAATLDAAATVAEGRGAAASAALVWERAAELGGPGRPRCERLLAAARGFALAGLGDHARRVAEDVLVATGDPVHRADAAAVLSGAGVWSTEVEHALAVASEAAEEVASLDRGRAVRALTQAHTAAMIAGEVTTARRLAERAVELAGGEAPGAIREDARRTLAMSLLLAGRAAESDRCLAGWRCPTVHDVTVDDLRGLPLIGTVQTLRGLGRLAEAAELVRVLLAACHRESAPAAKALVLGLAAEVWWWRGQWSRAVAAGAEAAHLAEETGQPALGWFSRGVAARVHAARGDETPCRRDAEAAQVAAEPHGLRPIRVYTSAAVGLLELGLGRPAAAADRLADAAAAYRASGWRDATAVPFAADHVEALVRAGRADAARAALAEHEDTAAGSGAWWADGALVRCRGLLADDPEEADHHFRAAVEHGPPTVPFEVARSRFCWGEHLRRRRDLARSRPLLRDARTVFVQLGAHPWEQRATEELRAAGDRSPDRSTSRTPALTPQELRCALAVADGMSNREAAAALFVSPKTVEYHLHKAYAKLGVGSRTQLARALEDLVPTTGNGSA